MEDDPVRLVVKNTFLQVDSGCTNKERAMRRRSDGDQIDLADGPPGEFFAADQATEEADDQQEPHPDSPMTVPVRKSTRSQRKASAASSAPTRYATMDEDLLSFDKVRSDTYEDEGVYDYVYPGGIPPPLPFMMPPVMPQGMGNMPPGYNYAQPMFMPGVDPFGYPTVFPHYSAPSAATPWQDSASSSRPRTNSRAGKGGGSKASSSSKASSNVVAEQRQMQPEEFTTVMMRNLPETYSRNALQQLLDAHSFKGEYDFIYMPMNFRSKASFGYAFVDFVSNASAQRCSDTFQEFKDWDVPSQKVCDVSWSNMHQGFKAHIERYKNSPVMHESVPDEYKPAIFSSNGDRAEFPPPTKKIRLPRIRRPGVDGGADGEDGADD